MNRIYSKVWNKSLGQIVVASELASCNDGGVAAAATARGAPGKRALAAALTAALLLGGGIVHAQPLDHVAGVLVLPNAVALGASAVVPDLAFTGDSGARDVVGAADPVIMQYENTDESATRLAQGPLLNRAAPMLLPVTPMALLPADPRRVPPPEVPSPGLVIGTGGTIGAAAPVIDPVVQGLLTPSDPNYHSGALTLAKDNVTRAFGGGLKVGPLTVPISVINTLTTTGGAVFGTGRNQHLTLLGGVTSGNYITNINNGATNGGILSAASPAWADGCLNILGLGLVTSPCWGVNAAQNYQTIIGDGAFANGSEEVVIGTNASHTLPAVSANTLFPGDGNRNSVTDPMGLPDDNYQARMGHSVVIGDNASGTANMQTILGASASSDQVNSVALGYGSVADRAQLTGYVNAPGLIGLAQNSAGAVAVGNTDHERQIVHVAAGTGDYDAVNVLQLKGAISSIPAAGDEHYYSVNSTATGVGSNYLNDGATGTNAVAAGMSASAAGDSAMAMGMSSAANGDSSIAQGNGAVAGVLGVLGTPATANDIAIGSGAQATGGHSIAIGTGNVVSGANSGAFGDPNSITGSDSYAVGNDNTIANANSFVLGNSVTTTQDNSVVLGNLSADRAATAITGDTINGVTYNYFGVGAVANGVVSVGAKDKERQIINVAAGEVSGSSTDAINGSQLFATNTAVTSVGTQVTDLGLAVATNLGGSSSYSVAGGLTAPSYYVYGADQNTVGDAITRLQNGAPVRYSDASGNPNPQTPSDDVTLIGSTAGAPVAMHNVADGAVNSSSNDAVNGSQLNAVNVTANKGWDVTTGTVTGSSGVASGTSSANVAPGGTATFNAGNNVVLTQTGAEVAIGVNPVLTGLTSIALTSGPSISSGGIDMGSTTISNLTAGVNSNDAVNVSQLNSTVAGAKVKYFSVNSTTGTNELNEGATGLDSIAIGKNAVAAGIVGSVAVGVNAVSQAADAVAMGNNAGNFDLASVLDNDGASVSIGAFSGNAAKSGFADGSGTSGVSAAVFVGFRAGQNSQGYRNSFVGANTGIDASAGPAFTAVLPNLIRGGGGNVGDPGHNAFFGDEAFGAGVGSWNSGVGTAALAGAQGSRNSALGFYAGFGTQGNDNVALGYMAGLIPGATNAAAPTTVKANDTVSIGRNALGSADDAMAVGQAARASGVGAVALGGQSVATNANDVALGASSVTAAPNIGTTATQVTLNGVTTTFQGPATVAAGVVSVGKLNSERQISNVAAGDLAAASTDAVNGSQLFATNEALNTLGDNAVQYDDSTKSKVTLGGTVSTDGGVVGGTTITNVHQGDVAANSTDAVNGSQLFATNQNVATNTTNISSNTTSITNLGNTITDIAGDTSTTYTDANGTGIRYARTNETGLTASDAFATGQGSTALGYGATTAIAAVNAVALGNTAKANGDSDVAIGANSTASSTGSDTNVALGANSTADGSTLATTAYNPGTRTLEGLAPVGEVSVGSTGAERRITNVAAGASDTDAVNVSQLKSVATDVTTLADNAVQYDDSTKSKVTLGGTVSTDGGVVGGTTITNVHQGDVAANSTDAVNGSQLFATNTAVTVVGTRVTNLGNSTATGLGGTSSYDASTGTLTTQLSVGGNNYTNVNDALTAVNTVAGKGWDLTTTAIGSGVANGTSVANVAPGATTTITADNNVIVTQAGADVAIGVNPVLTGLTSITLTSGPALSATGIDMGNTKITNLAPGTAGTDAVNLNQLNAIVVGSGAHYYSVNDNGTHAGNFNNDGATGTNALAAGVGASAGGTSSVAVGDTATAAVSKGVAIGSGATATNAGDVALGAGSVTSTAVGVSSATIGGVTYGGFAGVSPASAVSLGSVGNERQLQNVAAGQVTSTSTDAVNGSQLYSVASQVSQVSSTVTNLGNQVTTNSSDITNNTTNITNLQNGSDGMFQVSADDNGTKPVASGTKSSAGGNGSVASGAGSTAVGNAAQATGDNSVAIGASSMADRDDSVSVGAVGSERQITNVAAGTAQTDAVNVSQLATSQAGNVQYDRNGDGSINYTNVTMNQGGDPTVIHNVGAGVANNDAVNVGQLNAGISHAIDWSKNYTDQRFNTVNQQLNTIGNRANGGVASAMAMASLPQAYQPNQSSAGVALGNFHGETGIAVGVSTISESGRYIFKLNATSNTRGDTGVGVGAGVVW